MFQSILGPRFMTKIVQNINRINGYNKAVTVLESHFIVTRGTLKNPNLYFNSLHSVSSMYVIMKFYFLPNISKIKRIILQ